MGLRLMSRGGGRSGKERLGSRDIVWKHAGSEMTMGMGTTGTVCAYLFFNFLIFHIT